MTVEGSNSPYLDALLAGFTAKHSNVRVEKVPVAIDNVPAVKQMMIDGAFDLYPTGQAAIWYADGLDVALDLMPFIQKNRFDTEIYEPVRGDIYRRGRLISLPVTVNPNVIVYNKQLAAEAGVTMPEKSWTWDQFRELMMRLTKPGSNPVYGFYAGRMGATLLNVWVDQAIQPTVGQSEAAAIRDALAYLDGLMTAGATPVEPVDYTQGNLPLFGQKKAAITLKGTNELVSLNPFPADWETLPLPTHPRAKAVTPSTVVTYSISAGTKQAEAAWDLLSYMAGPEGAMIIAKQGRVPYRLTPEAKTAFLEASPRLPRSVADALDSQFIVLPNWLGRDRSSAMFSASFTVLSGGTVERAISLYDSLPQK